MPDFSPNGYSDLIRTILSAGYHFATLEEFDCDTPERQVILRHDVDYSPRKAAQMAELDSSLKVHSTFFFLVRGQWYNFLGHHTQEALLKIHALGFQIGLHFAPPPRLHENQGEYHQELSHELSHDFSIMRAEFPDACAAFSWHVPPPFALERGGFNVPNNMVDLYSERYFHRAKYVSDSSLRNPYSHLEQVFTSGRHAKAQLALHPECWIGRGVTDLADLLGEALSSVIADGEADLREKALLPSGIPTEALDQISAVVADAVRTVRKNDL